MHIEVHCLKMCKLKHVGVSWYILSGNVDCILLVILLISGRCVIFSFWRVRKIEKVTISFVMYARPYGIDRLPINGFR